MYICGRMFIARAEPHTNFRGRFFSLRKHNGFFHVPRQDNPFINVQTEDIFKVKGKESDK